MGSFNLKNNLVLSNVTVGTSVTGATGSHSFELGFNRKGKLRASASSFVSSDGKPTVAAFQFLPSVIAQNVTPQMMSDNDVRVIQFCKISYYSVSYAGRKDSDGMVDWVFRGPVLDKWHLDCLTNFSATSALNYPYYDIASTVRFESGYFPIVNDTPSVILDLDIRNSKTDRWNYLWSFSSKTEFVSYVVFIHKTGEREPLKGVRWSLDRSIDLKWSKETARVTSFRNNLGIVDKELVLKSGNELYDIMVNPGATPVINIESNNAISSLNNSPAIQYIEYNNWFPSVDADFWTV